MLKIKDDVDLKELENFGFQKTTRKRKTYKYYWGNGKEDYYTEELYFISNGINSIEILESRINSDWTHSNSIREVYIIEDDYDMGLSKGILEILYDLIKADLVEKVNNFK